MRSASRLLAAVRGRGIRAEARGAKLHLVAPPGTLDAALKAELAAHKAELLAELAAEADDHRERAHVLIAATFEKVTAFWIEGATLPPAELEAGIDDAALAGDLPALRQALEVYLAAARHAVEAVSPPAPAGPRLRAIK